MCVKKYFSKPWQSDGKAKAERLLHAFSSVDLEKW